MPVQIESIRNLQLHLHTKHNLKPKKSLGRLEVYEKYVANDVTNLTSHQSIRVFSAQYQALHSCEVISVTVCTFNIALIMRYSKRLN